MGSYPHITCQEDYELYKKAVDRFFEREDLTDLHHSSNEDTFFSWRPCECCSRQLGGDRYTCTGYNHNLANSQISHSYDICVDCLYYNEYGQLDDMTMLDYDLT